MKLSINTSTLAEATAWASRAVALNPARPVLAGLKLDASMDGLTLAGTNLESSGTVTVPASVGEPGGVILHAGVLTRLVGAMPSDRDMSLELDGSAVTLRCGRSRYSLQVMDDSAYPTLPEAPPVIGTVDGETFARAVRNVAHCVGKDPGRAWIMGMQVEFSGSTMSVMSTDSYRMAHSSIEWAPADPSFESRILVKPGALEAIAKIAAGELTVHLSDSVVGFTSGARFTTSVLMDAGKFPESFEPFLAVRPDTEPLEAATEDVVGAVNRAAFVLAGQNQRVMVKVEQDCITLDAGRDDTGQEIIDARYDGGSETYAFNPQYLAEAFRAVETEQVTMHLGDTRKPVVVTPVGQDGFRQVVMPIRM